MNIFEKILKYLNNGWIKTNNYRKVIKANPCWVYTNKKNVYTLDEFTKYFSLSETQIVTHYKPIKKPKIPKF